MINDSLRLDHSMQLVNAVEKLVPKKLAQILCQVASKCLFFQRFNCLVDFRFVEVCVNGLNKLLNRLKSLEVIAKSIFESNLQMSKRFFISIFKIRAFERISDFFVRNRFLIKFGGNCDSFKKTGV